MTEPDILPSDGSVAFRTCGHPAPARRVCDVCKTAHHIFAACSSDCLRAHLRDAHDPATPQDTAARARHAQSDKNRRKPDVSAAFAPHRERLMSLIPPGPSGGALCVLGAGNCDDLDLPRLARRFDTIHLVDVDGEAMQRARDAQPASVRDGIVLHGGVDLSGLLERLDEWGDAFPDDPALFQAAVSAAGAVTRAVGGPFQVTLSTCVLSQLIVPFQAAWAASAETWGKLNAALTAVHLLSLANITAAGGAASLIFDVLSSREVPALLELQDRSSAELEATIASWSSAGAVVLEPHPAALLAQLGQPGVAARAPAPELVGPWLWDTGSALHLVYAASFHGA